MSTTEQTQARAEARKQARARRRAARAQVANYIHEISDRHAVAAEAKRA